MASHRAMAVGFGGGVPDTRDTVSPFVTPSVTPSGQVSPPFSSPIRHIEKARNLLRDSGFRALVHLPRFELGTPSVSDAPGMFLPVVAHAVV